ncbi:hypothetical protein I7I50_04338 [Histoplasma capsulatum G186AR]|uniref:Uncharacterized protein n=1 Tax=Ajellomyces capsulatus TaxID=5037 RepID=A0A8H8CYX7_AJECA|nr:hypothetical protein I7I52_05246 [Histoplasma capsulatum]QSS75260.1 hypothetical protein I7I50_04338 [Histoplasma capsulatum G186AR]
MTIFCLSLSTRGCFFAIRSPSSPRANAKEKAVVDLKPSSAFPASNHPSKLYHSRHLPRLPQTAPPKALPLIFSNTQLFSVHLVVRD